MGKKGTKIIKEKSKRCKEYYALNNPTWTEEQCKEAAYKFNCRNNSSSIEYWKYKYPNKTIEECKQLKKEHLQAKKLKNPNYLEHYINKYPNLTLEEQKNKLQEYRDSVNRCKIIYWKKKYPNKTDNELEEYIKEAKRKCVTHDTSGDNNPNSKTKTTKLQRQQRSPNSIEFYKKHYPDLALEEQNKLLLEHRAKNRQRVKDTIKDTNIEYYLNKGMSMEDAKNALHDRQSTFSYKKCIEKYGKEKGEKRFKERTKKWLNNFYKSYDSKPGITQSNIATELFENLAKYINKDIKDCTEYKLYNKDLHKTYSYDFYYNTLLIEFNGDYWHMNPNIYNKNDLNKTVNRKASEIWNIDKIKCNFAQSNGYKIITIWESDYRYNKEQIIEDCIKYIDEENEALYKENNKKIVI